MEHSKANLGRPSLLAFFDIITFFFEGRRGGEARLRHSTPVFPAHRCRTPLFNADIILLIVEPVLGSVVQISMHKNSEEAKGVLLVSKLVTYMRVNSL